MCSKKASFFGNQCPTCRSTSESSTWGERSSEGGCAKSSMSADHVEAAAVAAVAGMGMRG